MGLNGISSEVGKKRLSKPSSPASKTNSLPFKSQEVVRINYPLSGSRAWQIAKSGGGYTRYPDQLQASAA